MLAAHEGLMACSVVTSGGTGYNCIQFCTFNPFHCNNSHNLMLQPDQMFKAGRATRPLTFETGAGACGGDNYNCMHVAGAVSGWLCLLLCHPSMPLRSRHTAAITRHYTSGTSSHSSQQARDHPAVQQQPTASQPFFCNHTHRNHLFAYTSSTGDAALLAANFSQEQYSCMHQQRVQPGFWRPRPTGTTQLHAPAVASHTPSRYEKVECLFPAQALLCSLTDLLTSGGCGLHHALLPLKAHPSP